MRCAFSRAEVNCVVMESHGVMVAAPDMATVCNAKQQTFAAFACLIYSMLYLLVYLTC